MDELPSRLTAGIFPVTYSSGRRIFFRRPELLYFHYGIRFSSSFFFLAEDAENFPSAHTDRKSVV